MFTVDFIEQYARNMYRSLYQGRTDLSGLNLDCDFCPLFAECAADPATRGCTSFLTQVLQDGNEFVTALD